MNILQSTIERLLYILLLVLFILNVGVAIIAYHDGQEIKYQTSQIEQNQVVNSTAVKQYIACLLTITPHGNIPVTVQEKNCFDNSSEVK